MIRYYCNGCSVVINREDVTSVAIQSASYGKKVFHFCPVCSKSVVQFVATYSAESNDTLDKVVEEEKETEDVEVAVEVEEEQSIDVGIRDYDDILSVVDKLFEMDHVMYMDAIRPEYATKYLKAEYPCKVTGHTDTQRLFSALVSFYRGRSYSSIRKRFCINDMTLDLMLRRYCSIYAYERWFTKKKFLNRECNPIDVGEVLACVENRSNLNDMLSDTDMDDKSQLIEILEYYTCIRLSEKVRDTYIHEIGGDSL